MAVAIPERESDSELRRTGFRASLPGVDLASLLQLVSMSKERRVVQVSSGKILGYLYMSQGRPCHAALEGEHGESSRGLPAAIQLLGLRDGDVCLTDRPFPPVKTLDMPLEELLIRAANAHDEADTRARASAVLERAEEPAARGGEPGGADAVIASVRLNEYGQLVSSTGKAQVLAQLVAYVTRMTAIVAHHLALSPFVALEAELGGQRVLVFVDGADLVGLVLADGASAAELRKQLGL
jgi:Domain of unknown function (DUF4388)